MSHLPTVRVVNPAAPDGYMIINASELRNGHKIWTDDMAGQSVLPAGKADSARDAKVADSAASAGKVELAGDGGNGSLEVSENSGSVEVFDASGRPAESADLRVGKGPRGKYYVLLGKERVEGPFETEEDAQKAIDGRSAQ